MYKYNYNLDDENEDLLVVYHKAELDVLNILDLVFQLNMNKYIFLIYHHLVHILVILSRDFQFVLDNNPAKYKFLTMNIFIYNK